MCRAVTALSLFAGAGGCDLGFSRAGIHIIRAYDNNEAAVNTYNKNFGTGAAELCDLSTARPDDIANDVSSDKYPVDILIGGPPCQGFSSAGIRFFDDPRNHLIRNYIDILERIKPKWFLMENVEGMLTLDGGSFVYEALKGMIHAGYVVRLEKIYSTDYGVPQRRKRVIILGNRKGIPFNFPDTKDSILGCCFRDFAVSLRSAISDLETSEVTLPDHSSSDLVGIALERISLLKPGQSMKDLPEYLQHKSFRRRANRRVSDGTPTEKRGGSPSGIKRLVYDEPCLTITSAATREFVHPVLDRPLTIRECARIQTFPDDFVFTGTPCERIKQVGNAIPPRIAEIFANHILYLETQVRATSPVRPQLLGFNVTKSSVMSPALSATCERLLSLMDTST